jgi:hypothetical protein
MVSIDLNAISDLLDKALDLDAGAREPWLAELAQTEPDLAAKLRALLSRQGELETDQLLIGDGRVLGSAVLTNTLLCENSVKLLTTCISFYNACRDSSK